MPNANQERFARAAQTWDENPARAVVADAIADAIRGEVPVTSETDAMDCGCGTGLLTLALQPHVRNILGVDTSAEMLQVLGEKIAAAGVANVRVRQVDLAEGDLGEDFDLGEGFALVVSAMMLHHVKDAGRMVERLAALVRPGGHLCLADLDAEDGSFHPDKTGIEHFGFGEEEMRGMFTVAGLGNVRVRAAHVIRRPDAEGVMREYPVLLTVGERGEG
jgi:tRNA (cmo5U34)-methyltransferase